jgi:catechol 2,3-dioxygenase-like lactoylglutathione lyase family enzyme
MIWQFVPRGLNDTTELVRSHFVVYNFTEQTRSVSSHDRNEIRAGLRVIVSAQSDRTAAAFRNVVIHRGPINNCICDSTQSSVFNAGAGFKPAPTFQTHDASLSCLRRGDRPVALWLDNQHTAEITSITSTKSPHKEIVMFDIKGIRTFATSAKDLDKAVEFYTKVIGGQIVKKVEPTDEQKSAGQVKEVDVRLGNFEVHLFDASIKPREVDPHHTLNIPWQEKEKALAALQQIGANIEKVRAHRDGVNYSINVFDPDGNRWELSFAKEN